MTTTTWRDLLVTADGITAPLSELRAEVIEATEDWDGDRPVIVTGYFLHAHGEEPDWDTPRVSVNWTGFRANPAAIRLGRRGARAGGQSTSRAKREAARANGQKGGRPRKPRED